MQLYGAIKPMYATSVKLISELTGKGIDDVRKSLGAPKANNKNKNDGQKSKHKNKDSVMRSGPKKKKSQNDQNKTQNKNKNKNKNKNQNKNKSKSKSKNTIDLTGLDSLDDTTDDDIDEEMKNPSKIRKNSKKYKEYRQKIKNKKRSEMSSESDIDNSSQSDIAVESTGKIKEKKNRQKPKPKRQKKNKIKIQPPAIKPQTKVKSKLKSKLKSTENKCPFEISPANKKELSSVIHLGCKNHKYPKITIKTCDIDKWTLRRQVSSPWIMSHFAEDSLKDYLGQFEHSIQCGIGGSAGVGIFADKEWNIKWYGNKALCIKENPKKSGVEPKKLNLHWFNTCHSEMIHWYQNDSHSFLEGVQSLMNSWPTDEEILEYIKKRNPTIKWTLLPENVLQYLGALEYCINVKMLEFGVLNGDIIRNKILYNQKTRSPSFVTNLKSPDFVAQNNGGYKFRGGLDPVGIQIWQRVGYHKLSLFIFGL